MVRRSPRLAAASATSAAVEQKDSTKTKRGRKQTETSSDTQSTVNSFEVELDIASILGAITERLFEHTSHRLFDYYADLISSTYEKELQLDYICNLFEIAIQTMTLTKDVTKRDALFTALRTLSESVFGMMDIPMAKKIRLNTVIRHLQKL